MTKFITVPHPILRKKSKSVKKIDKNVLAFIAELKKALLEAQDPPGVGLSAVQIGKPWRMFLARESIESPPMVFINPEITWRSKRLTDGVPRRSAAEPKKENRFEGCLSVPGYYGLVKRHQAIRLRWQDEKGQKRTGKFSHFLATVIQHETDHINGILFIDRVLEQANRLYKIQDGEFLETQL